MITQPVTEKSSAYTGPFWREDAYGVAIAASEEAGVIAVGLGDGRVALRLLDKPETPLSAPLAVHQGGLAALSLAVDGKSFLSAGEDGVLARISADGKVEKLFTRPRTWFEHMEVDQATGHIALAFKKTVLLLDKDGALKAEFAAHPSAVGGITFDAKGKRLAVSHYGGVSLYWVNGEAAQAPQVLNWKGSHLSIAFSPNGKYLQTAMQENALHGWRLPGFDDFQMSGYALKPKSFGWNPSSRWLASSGAVGIVCWDCSGKGPMGRAPVVLGEECTDVVTRVACHPELDLVAAGTAGGRAYLARFQDDVLVPLQTIGGSEITDLRWSATGATLLAASENGYCYTWSFAE